MNNNDNKFSRTRTTDKPNSSATSTSNYGSLTRTRRIPPSSTPPPKTTRGSVPSPRTKSSTPTGVSSSTPNRSCNFSPIRNPSEKSTTEPKILKTLGPQLNDRKNSFRSNDGSSKTKTSPPDPIALYMMYQQQHYLNSLMTGTRDNVLSEGKKQLEDLWSLVKTKKSEIAAIESRTLLVNKYVKNMKLTEDFEQSLKEATGIVQNASSVYQDLAQGLDGTRHKIQLTNINPVDEKDIEKISQLIEQAAIDSSSIQDNKIKEIVEASAIISRLDETSCTQTKMMEECQRIAMSTLTRLGQELSLGTKDETCKKLADINF